MQTAVFPPPALTFQNVVPLAVQPKAAGVDRYREPFKIRPFTNRGGSKSWRVEGFKRDGTRVRENFAELKAAECRKVALTSEWLVRESETTIRATKLTDVQVKLAEMAFMRLENDQELMLAVDQWLTTGRQSSRVESPRLDEAVDSFLLWLEGTDTLRARSKRFLKSCINVFRNSVPNLRVADITPELIHKFLDGRHVSSQTRINDRLAISRFFSWAQDRPRRWATVNPCQQIRLQKPVAHSPPPILSVEDCRKLLSTAEKFKKGRLAPYVACCLFGGLRPSEVERLDWRKVNLVDREIRIESQSTKTKKPRVVAIDDTLAKWLTGYRNKAFRPVNLRKQFDCLKRMIGFAGRLEKDGDADLRPWPQDVMRHTAISHFFRKTGSYGLAAEQFGNSETIIKKHYQSRVSSQETNAFYALLPTNRRK
jgi:integrase